MTRPIGGPRAYVKVSKNMFTYSFVFGLPRTIGFNIPLIATTALVLVVVG